MTALIGAILLSGAVALATGGTDIPVSAQNALTTIDVVPTKQQITSAFGKDEQTAKQNLATIAKDQEQQNVGLRLRAIHALAKYCGAPPSVPCLAGDLAHESLVAVIGANRMETTGARVLVLRAAIETLGTLEVAGDVATLLPLLDHPSRDIRAATARALRDLCNAQAITPLRARYSNETTDQVKLAISEALRILGQCSTNL